MTNFNYIMSQMKDTDLAVLITTGDFSSQTTVLSERIQNAFWRWCRLNRKNINLECQVWLSLPYRPEEWEIEEN